MNAKEPQPVPMVPNGENNRVILKKGGNLPVKNVIRQPAPPPPPSPPKAKSK
jgi:hypothetical protein